MELRICNKCGKKQTINNFRKCFYKNGKSYYKSFCKNCEREYSRRWTKNNPEYKKQYYENNKDRINERSKQWRKDNIEHAREIHRQYCRRNKEKRVEKDRRYLENNREKVYAKNERWRKFNLGKKNSVVVRRRARKLNQTPIDANKEKIMYMYQIANKMTEESDVEYQVDHIKPISKGGLHHEDNIQILRKDLNLKKSNKWPLAKEEKLLYVGIKFKDLKKENKQ